VIPFVEFMLNKKYISILVLIIAVGITIRYGILPAWDKINSDFPNYYTASRLVTEGKDISKIYNDAWFAQQIKNYGIDEPGKFSPFPPPTIFVLVPFASFDSITAKRLFIILNIILLLGTAYIFKKISTLNYINCLNIILISGAGVINNFLLGQMYLLLLFSIALGYFYLNRNDIKTGVLWGMGAAIKYFPIIYIPILLIKKQWKGLLSLIITIIIINLITLVITGYDIYREFINSVLFNHINGELSSQSKYAVQFQSWNSLLRNLFIEDPIENKMPLFNSPGTFIAARVLIYLIFIGATVYIVYRIRHGKNFLAFATIILTLLALVLSPASATYHLLLLSFPLILLLFETLGQKKIFYSICFISVYILIGYLPFVINNVHFLKENLLFGFYRLWLLVIFFIAAARFILNSRREIN
jgi:hypothetical protein